MSRIQEFDFSVDLLQAILWEYNDAENLQSILTKKQEWYDENQRDFWGDWYRDVFDLRTANEFGLSVWSIILDLPLSIGVAPAGGPAWGFGEFNENFNNGNFQPLGSTVINLTKEQARLALQLRYYQLVSRGTVPDLNFFLSSLFGAGSAYVIDALDMSIIYVFAETPSAALQFIIDELDILPRPSGVKVTQVDASRPVWGFGEFNQNFDNGNFLS